MANYDTYRSKKKDAKKIGGSQDRALPNHLKNKNLKTAMKQ